MLYSFIFPTETAGAHAFLKKNDSTLEFKMRARMINRFLCSDANATLR